MTTPAHVPCFADCDDGRIELEDGTGPCPRCDGSGHENCHDCAGSYAVAVVEPIEGDRVKLVRSYPRKMEPGIALCAQCVAGRRAEGLAVTIVGTPEEARAEALATWDASIKATFDEVRAINKRAAK
jgi:hypothetical protein